MPIVTVRFDRVFDVVQINTKDQCTLFSMECAGRTHYGIRIPGQNALHDRMVVTAFLAREDDWQTLVGWREHSTGKIIYRTVLIEFAPVALAFVLAAFAIVARHALPALATLALAAMALATLAWGIGAMRRRARILEQLGDAPGLTP